MSINQFALAIWYPCYYSNNLNIWKLCSTIAEKCEEAEASNSCNFAWQNEQINGRIEDAHLCCWGEQKATWSSASWKVCLRGKCSSQASNTNFETLETLQEALWCRPLHKFCGEANCMYGYPLLIFNSALSNFNGFTFHSHYCMQSGLDIDKAHPPTQEAWSNVLQSGIQ